MSLKCGVKKTIASGLVQRDIKSVSYFIMWKMESNCSPSVLTSKTILFPFVAYKKGRNFHFYPGCDHTEKEAGM